MSTTETKLEWGCTGHQPTRWMLGERNGNRLTNAVAYVIRCSNGSWGWACLDETGGPDVDRRGIEPSRETAMDAAGKELSQMTQ